jgi:hypothetical protein
LGIAGAAVLSLTGRTGEAPKPATPLKPKLAVSIKPQHVADALRAVILSDREVYTMVAANEYQALSPTNASTRPESSKSLPSPCEMLRLGSQAAASKGVEYSYVLRSLRPVNKRNAPETEVETKGLQFVGTRPDLIYTSDELLGGRWYFTAVYPDVAVNQSCVSCHRRLQPSVGSELKLGDVIGALVVRIALEL